MTPSDLGFFEAHFDKANVSGQKSLNLNRRVFIDQIYPDLPALLAADGWAMPVALQVNGPGAGFPPLQLTRKITKRGSRNWRLNGEVLPNPKDAANRFAGLTPGDLALLAFEGAAAPTYVRFYAVSQADPDDIELYAALLPAEGVSMASLTSEALASAISVAPTDHPVHDLFLEADLTADLDEAAQGDADATRRILARPGNRKVSAEQLAAARQRAQELGLEGELLIRDYFDQMSEEDFSWTWSSAENAICPWDFYVTRAIEDGRVEVKSTRGPHGTHFHISMAELIAAAQGPRYDIYRVSELGEEGGMLSIAENIGDFARGILKILSELPKGIRPDSLSVDPGMLTWQEPYYIAWSDAEEA